MCLHFCLTALCFTLRIFIRRHYKVYILRHYKVYISNESNQMCAAAPPNKSRSFSLAVRIFHPRSCMKLRLHCRHPFWWLNGWSKSVYLNHLYRSGSLCHFSVHIFWPPSYRDTWLLALPCWRWNQRIGETFSQRIFSRWSMEILASCI